MVSELKRKNVPHVQQRFDPQRPDLTKLDQLLGMLAMDHDTFDKQAEKKAAQLENDNAPAPAAPSSSSAATSSTPKPAK
jgi:hypothetical protein